MFCFLHIFIQKQNTVILYTAKSNRVPLLYPATLPHYLSITQVYFLFFDIFPPFYEIIAVTIRQRPSQQLFYIFTPKQVLCQSEIYLFLSARLFTFSFCCMFSARQSVSEKCFTQDVRHNLQEILGMIFQTHSKAAAEEDE